MGKNKRNKLLSAGGNKKQKLNGKGARPTGVLKLQALPKPRPKGHINIQHSRPVLPFDAQENILLIGDGDLSFARSLVEGHGCANVNATVFESEAQLKEKYPHVTENIAAIEEAGGSVKYGVDAGKMKPWVEGKGGRQAGKGVMDRIFFNFPHVGGKSTDVNRQVRYNQELLVAFFKNSAPSLSPRAGSSIIVTLFEGEPYTLWNIRDLGRHSGFQVQQSFKFQATAYPGYKHARTLGVVKGKNGDTGGGWKGEERKSRSYVFVRKGEAPPPGLGKGKKADSSGEEDNAWDDDIQTTGDEIELDADEQV